MHRPLRESDLLSAQPLRRLGRRVELFDQIDSTNAYLLANAADVADGTIVAAESQTAGRGRLGRKWAAPRGASILMSVLLHEREGSPLIALAALAGALAAAEAVALETTCEPVLRWPNDLFAGDRKLGGVLAETTSLPTRSAAASNGRALVIGIGLNCLQHAGHFADDLRDRATSLEIACDHAIDREALAGRLVGRMDHYVCKASDDHAAWEQLRTRWLDRCDDLGRHIQLIENGQNFSGTVLDITPIGDLLVQLDSGGRRQFESATTTRNR